MSAREATWILGISAFYHDSAACLVRDGEIVAAASEERFTRKKGDASFPSHAVDFCLQRGGIGIGDLAHVAFYSKPLLTFERILETYVGLAPKGLRSFLKAGPLWIKEKLYQDHLLRRALDDFDGDVLYAEHHESHAASAFYPSPFEQSAILTMDGVGEWATASIGVGTGSDLELTHEMHWPDSLGLLYSAFTAYLGFRVNSGEQKVMGLAPYGQPRFVDQILTHLIDLKSDGSFKMNQSYFDYLGGTTMTSRAFDELFGGPPRVPDSALTERDMDIARSVQDVCEEIMLRMAKTVRRTSGSDNLCLAGGVALNCVGNGKILRSAVFKNIWIQPAAGDAGGALGVALLVWHRHCGGRRTIVPGMDSMKGSLLGPEFSDQETELTLESFGAVRHWLSRTALTERVATLLASGMVVAWMNGAMEFGPRSLGARSILGDARKPEMQSVINRKVKFREDFRPFAPSVLRPRVGEYFEFDGDSPYMLLVTSLRAERRVPPTPSQSAMRGVQALSVARSDIPSVTHVDYSARVHTVTSEPNPDYHALLVEFDRQTGCPVLINTSFNVRGEPVVCTPADAYRCFMRTQIDYLVVGTCLMDKIEQPAWPEEGDWKETLRLD